MIHVPGQDAHGHDKIAADQSETRKGEVMSARLQNVKLGDFYGISRISTRLSGDNNATWEITTIVYGDVEGYKLPQKIVVQHRNTLGAPVKALPDVLFEFKNYHINKGEAVELLKALPAPAPAPTPKP